MKHAHTQIYSWHLFNFKMKYRGTNTNGKEVSSLNWAAVGCERRALFELGKFPNLNIIFRKEKTRLK